jgi:hypothetical protein
MESRDTSLGSLPILEPPRGRPVSEGRLHALGLGLTVAVHAAVLITVLVMNYLERQRLGQRVEEPYEAIEAGLAIKKKSTEAPKSKLPQKDTPPPPKPPDAPKIATNPDLVPQPKDKKKDPPPDAEEEIFNRFRSMDTRAKDEQEVEGADDGSEYGTLEKAKGDPYVGELIGRMTKDFVVPSVVSDRKLKTWGCVKLDDDGKIMDRALDPDNKSRSHAFNSAVEAALKRTTDMEQPVPNHLKNRLVGKFVCVTYTSNIE